MTPSDLSDNQDRTAEAAFARSSGCVLVVDDDDAVREVIVHVLRAGGWDPLPAHSAAVGEQLFLRHRDRIGLILTDIAMPERNGYWLAGRIRSTCRRVPIIGISGYREVTEHADDYFLRFLPKPFLPGELLAAVRESYSDPAVADKWAEPVA